MDDPFRRPTMTPALCYRDPKAALDWLEKAFGFARCMVITEPDGTLAHAEMRFGKDGLIHIGTVWADHLASPADIGARNTQVIHVHLENDIDAHCAHAREAGATIVRDLEDQFYGDRTYAARDLEGHVWNFGQTMRHVSREEAEKVSGLNIDGWA